MEYTEKLICKNCNDVSFRPLEVQTLHMNNDLNADVSAYAVIIKQYKCSACGSTDFKSLFIKGKVEEQNNVIKTTV